MSRLIDRLRACAVAVFVVLALGACASTSGPGAPAGASSTVDPLEPLNRGVYAFNDVVDEFFLRPLAVAYDKYMPDTLQFIARNFLSNLYDPYVGLNNLLQGKPRDAISDLGRFLVNSTIGLRRSGKRFRHAEASRGFRSDAGRLGSADRTLSGPADFRTIQCPRRGRLGR
jgi:phospholipid-binding lipoprotein MlaA